MKQSRYQTLDSLNQSVRSWLYSVKNVELLTQWLLKFTFIKVKVNPFTPINVIFIHLESFFTKCCTIGTLLIIQQKKWKVIKEFIWSKSLEFSMFSLIGVYSSKLLEDAIGISLCRFLLFSEWKKLIII